MNEKGRVIKGPAKFKINLISAIILASLKV
jgi:hypothetical protein